MKTILAACCFMLLISYPLSEKNSEIKVTERLRPLPTGEQLNSICIVDNNVLISAGKNGTIIRRSDHDSQWQACFSNTKSDLNSIDFSDKYNGIAVGTNGTIIRTLNSGFTWLICKSRTAKELFAVKFVDSASAFACGLSGTILKTTDCGNYWSRIQTNSNDPMFCMDFSNKKFGCVGSFNSVFITSDSGKTWSKKQFNFIPTAQITGICRVDSLTIFASANPLNGRFIKSTDGGETWLETSLNLPLLYGGAVDLVRDIHFKDKFSGTIVTEFGSILKTIDGGISWSIDSTFRRVNEKPSLMRCVVSNSSKSYISGGGGTIFESDFISKNWQISSGGLNSIEAVCFTDEENWLIGGEGNDIFTTYNYGVNWNITGRTNSGNIFSITFENANTGFVATENGIEKTVNAGTNWQKIYPGSFKAVMHSFDKTFLFAGGGEYNVGKTHLIRSSDAGISWVNSYSGNDGSVTNMSVTTDGYIFASTTFGKVLSSSDNGISWNVSHATDEKINCVLFKNSSSGVAASVDGTILKTTDGGNIWEMIYTGLSRDIQSICIYDEGYAAVGENGYVVHSTDGGETWSVLNNITSNNLNSVRAITGGRIFCFGDFGTVISYDLMDKDITGIIKPADATKSVNVTASPNPMKSETKIQLRSGTDMFQIFDADLFDATGRRIEVEYVKEDVNGFTVIRLDASQLSTGIYLFRIASGSFTTFIKLAKIK
ncbi:MAG: hypothetical protein IPL67_03200 [Ignavibacteria bacterium]|nr:hypothetical protein [Ignavibacteria bacterium]